MILFLTDCHLFARVFYDDRQVSTFDLDKQNSACRVLYGKQEPAIENTTVTSVYNHLYGTCDIKQIQLPELQCSNETQRVLASFSRGLVLQMSSDGDVFATRKSMTKVAILIHFFFPSVFFKAVIIFK